MTEYVSTATATIRLPMSTSPGAAADRSPAGAIRVVPVQESPCCGGACCAG